MRHSVLSYVETRIRNEISRWKFSEPVGSVARRLACNFELFRRRLPPAVASCYMRALWNGVPTSRRMASCESFTQRNCVFNCAALAQDSLEHYCRCRILNEALQAIRGARALSQHPFGIDVFFGCVKGFSQEDCIQCACLTYVRCQLILFARRNGGNFDWKLLAGVYYQRSRGGSYTG